MERISHEHLYIQCQPIATFLSVSVPSIVRARFNWLKHLKDVMMLHPFSTKLLRTQSCSYRTKVPLTHTQESYHRYDVI